jgi:hypothetical protein
MPERLPLPDMHLFQTRAEADQFPTLEDEPVLEFESLEDYQSLKLKIVGVCPLLMHNGRLADPSYNFSQAMSPIRAKRKKTEADLEELAHLEYLGSLYLYNQNPCIPGEVLESTLINGAKKLRIGPQAKSGILCDGMYELEYDGPKNAHELWNDLRFRLTVGVRVQQNRIMRTRPKFNEWATNIEVKYLPDIISERQIREIVEIAGRSVGLCDWRPRYGRFKIVDGDTCY